MEIDQWLFKKLNRYLAKKQDTATGLPLEKVGLKLTFIARALTANAILIYPAQKEGGVKNDNFFIPENVPFLYTLHDHYQFYLYKTVYLSTMYNLANEQKFIENSNNILLLNTIQDQYPSIYEVHNTLKENIETYYTSKKEEPEYNWLYGKYYQATETAKEDQFLENYSEIYKQEEGNTEVTTLKAKAIEEIKSVTIDKKQQEDYTLNHYFEKVETADEFNGNWRDFDGADDIAAHKEAMDELNLNLTVRTDETAHSIYQTDFLENINIAESAEKKSQNNFVAYSEWHYKKKTYVPDFCKVYPYADRVSDKHYYTNCIHQYQHILVEMRKLISSTNNKMKQQKRQNDGFDFDIDAMPDLFVDITNKRTANENIYLNKRKKEADFSCLILLDTSLSSDGYVDGKKILDIEKEVTILFSEILNEYQIPFSIAHFSSKTRNYLQYNTVKKFNEKWNSTKEFVGGIECGGYTRIGGALRHAGTEIGKTAEKNKWILFLSDGKPNDYDKYEGSYGINDVRQAIRELKKNDINIYALAMEAKAKYYLPQMFGQSNFKILPHTKDLLENLIALFEKIKFRTS